MRLSVDSQEPQGDVLARAKSVLDAHGVVALPTETFYALAASALDERACARIFEIKGRASTKALPCLVADLTQLGTLALEITPLTRTLAAKFWPGPLTLVVPAREGVAAASESGTVAVRVSSHPIARALSALAGPVTATSANASGSPSATTADEVDEQLGDAVDLLLDGGATAGGLASTIVDVTSGHARLVRRGVIPFGEVSNLDGPPAQS